MGSSGYNFRGTLRAPRGIDLLSLLTGLAKSELISVTGKAPLGTVVRNEHFGFASKVGAVDASKARCASLVDRILRINKIASGNSHLVHSANPVKEHDVSYLQLCKLPRNKLRSKPIRKQAVEKKHPQAALRFSQYRSLIDASTKSKEELVQCNLVPGEIDARKT